MAELIFYKARDDRGNLVTGSIETADLKTAREFLHARGYFVVELKPLETEKKFEFHFSFSRKVGTKDLALFCRQLAVMLSAGMTLTRALSTLEAQLKNKELRQALKEIGQDIERGLDFSAAAKKHPRIFPSLFSYMVEAGETGGIIEEILENLADHFEWSYSLEEKFRSAMTYPLLVLTIAAGAILLLFTFIIPIFSEILLNIGGALPLPTMIVLAISNFLRKFWYLLLLLVLVGFFLGRFFLNQPEQKKRWDKVKLSLPVLGELNQKMAISRFSHTLGMLVRGGVPILKALEVTKNTADNLVISEAVEKARANIRQGEAMAPPLAATGVFPPMVTEMIAVGEETGALDLLLEKVGYFYDREVEATTAQLTSLLEPFLIVSLGVVVGFIILSVMLPIVSITTTLPV